MGEEVELAAKAAGEVVAALAERSGALAVPSEYAEFIAARIHLRHMPALVDRAMATAEKIRASGLPRRAWETLDEPLVTAILLGMAEETDPNLVEAWESLLANEVTQGSAEVRRAFPGILRELDPRDAQVLDRWAQTVTEANYLVERHDSMPGERDGAALGNLVRLGLVDP